MFRRYALGALATWITLGLLLTIHPPEAFGVATYAGLALWVMGVLGVLTVAVERWETRIVKPWQLLLLLALCAGAASALINGLTYAFVDASSRAFPEGAAAWTGSSTARDAMITGFFDGDALFGFWALTIELPRRLGAQAELAAQRNEWKREAELVRVRRGLEPHFLLNTLNTISSHVTTRPHEARELLGVLGDLLRELLEGSDAEYQPVGAQVTWLKTLCRILESRHEHRLTFAWSVDASVRDELLPSLLIQPILENAVAHGALRRPNGGRVAVRIEPDGALLRCVVDDDGPGFRGAPFGRGLRLTQRRIELEDGRMCVESSSAGTRITVVLPRRAA